MKYFIIYSEVHDMKCEQLFDMLEGKINCKLYLVIEKNDLQGDYGVVKDKYILIKFPNQDILQRIYLVFSTIFQDFEGMFVCNNRMNFFPNINQINHLIDNPRQSDDEQPFQYIDKHSTPKDLEPKKSLEKQVTRSLYIVLSGRLCNQLFQIASGYGLSTLHSMQLILTFDDKCNPEYSHTLFGNKNLLFIKNQHIDPSNLTIYSELDGTNNFMTCNQIITTPTNYLIQGYLQNEKYFKQYRDKICQLVSDSKIIMEMDAKYPNAKDCYFLHIRRGDYVDNPYYLVDYDKYYNKAIQFILSKSPNPHFYIFSDDIEYCKQYNVLDQISKQYIEENTLYSLHLMSRCLKGGIACNSTFSWWGGWLNSNKEKVVVFPNRWFNTGQACDIYFENSHIISC